MDRLARALVLLLLVFFTAASSGAQIIDHSNPASGNDDLVASQSYAWGPIFLGGICRLTDKGTSETSSIFSQARVNISKFETSFVFEILSGGPGDTSDGDGNCADGLTFTIQAQGPTAMGAAGGSLGYEGIARSVCIKFDTVPNGGDPSVSSTGLFTNGQGPFGGYDLLKDGVKLRSQHPFRVDMKYDGRVLKVRIADMVTGVDSIQVYQIDIPATIGSRSAHVGFTAATGLGSSAQDILKWYFASPPSDRGPRLGRIESKSESIRSALDGGNRGLTVAAWPVSTKPIVKAPMTRATSIRRGGLLSRGAGAGLAILLVDRL